MNRQLRVVGHVCGYFPDQIFLGHCVVDNEQTAPHTSEHEQYTRITEHAVLQHGLLRGPAIGLLWSYVLVIEKRRTGESLIVVEATGGVAQYFVRLVDLFENCHRFDR